MKLNLIVFILLPYWLRAQIIDQSAAHKGSLQLKYAIERYNPALNVYNPKFDDECQKVVMRANHDSLNIIEYFQLLSSICAASNEGHFSLGNWQDTVHSGFLNNEYEYLPISVVLVQKRLFVWKDFSNSNLLEQGDEILTINGVLVEDVIDELISKVPCDGDIETYAVKKIQSGFNWMYYLLIDQPDIFYFEYLNSNGIEKSTEVSPLTRNQHFENYEKYYGPISQTKVEDFYTLEIEAGIATLTLPTFSRSAAEKADIKAKNLYKEVFKELQEKQINDLILDLRGNQGGLNEFADEMVKYLVDENSNTDFLKKSVSWKGKEKTYKVPKRSKYAFEGNIYVLINGLTFSNGSVLARYLKEFSNAIIIGEESGSRYEGFAAGSSQYIYISNTSIRIGIPRYHILFPKSEKQKTQNRGLLPDYKIEYSIDDLIEGKDLHMEKALALIQE